ncbi:flagellar motor protein MotB [Rhodanobacter sp. AS-Z3]|uniref:flagellar motor protein MotB n=1 Tax=Rhodanobacter sp. AS-Z3 TaxID=3031330 RepID=UPI00247930CD|nr:flagellar motor protein MotB [Rhodanobacter sp. AS-Z3]WEN16494.1 flagellar motor protein MotB [Rhodanobacter sp. AS-Z3]
MSDDSDQTIIIRKRRRQKHGHHGGAWKVAYADFVTAMMAFFLVMWLIGVGTREQKAAISEYFKNPSMTPGTATVAPPGKDGPGGASDSMIAMGGAMDISRGPGKDRHGVPAVKHDVEEARKQARAADKARLQELMKHLNAAIQNSQALAPFKDQLLIDITPEGLRIQIVDKLNRPMFDIGSASLKPYTVQILHELGETIDGVPNKISISGHTDDARYSSEHNYSNWELSADRGNAARRALIDGGLDADKISRVVGLAASVPFDKQHPADPINRRISIIVMTDQAESAARAQEAPDAKGEVPPASSASSASPAASASSTLPVPPVVQPASVVALPPLPALPTVISRANPAGIEPGEAQPPVKSASH